MSALQMTQNVSGSASATSGLATATIATIDRADPSLLGWLNDNAAAIGVMFTAATFAVYLVSNVLSKWLERQEHLARIDRLRDREGQ